ncbi:MAG: Holliday junction branch migration protein RuvA [Firmicutes bacterium]|nr:Holliday junction branch migration protein RuvA [Bacillota bacterium]
MIRYIKGYLAMTFGQGIIVESSSGIGFQIFLPVGSPLYGYGLGEEIKVFTSMSVKEDDISLYGFPDKESLELFELLTTVSGIGAKAGMALLSALPPADLRRAIVFEDVKEISKANGIGKKTAERVILELKDKIGKLDGVLNDNDFTISGMVGDILPAADERAEAVNALIALGYSKGESIDAVSKVTDEGLSCEAYIKKALRHLF